MIINKIGLNDLYNAISKEYLLTNGLGGFSSASICGCNINKYNALLVAALTPPVSRRVLLSKLDETICIENEKYKIYTNQYHSGEVEKGFMFQQDFQYDYFPIFNYIVKGVIIEKKITMVYSENKTVITYNIINNSKPMKMVIDVLVNNRDHHQITKKYDFKCKQITNKNGTNISFDTNDTQLFLQSDKGTYSEKNQWNRSIYYKEENDRGFKANEYDFKAGVFEIFLKPMEKINFTIVASTEEINDTQGENYFINEINRKDELIKNITNCDEKMKVLAFACDQFIVERQSTKSATVIAGYPWFTDWGRDTMIAFTGLTLVTGRYKDAREILLTFSQYIKNGLVPNMFPDNGQEPLYNTVDASLWYFIAVYKYLKYTGDYDFVKNNIFMHLTEIIESYMNGTDFNIGMDKKDCLLIAGNEDTQITWMDVKIGNFAVTPRQGKAVEINALWYNAICIYMELCRNFNVDCKNYEIIKQNVVNNFIKQFWNDDKSYLYDYINENEANEDIRPNAIIAIGLPFEIVPKEFALKIIATAFEELYTIYGLRSLNTGNEKYKGQYIGDTETRDLSYHQGPVWTWLMGPFITAINRYYKDKEFTKQIFELFYQQVEDKCIGNVSEILEGDYPHLARACSAQAWGVGEMMRVYYEEVKE
ncbi:amylo-alpha-1,6-glucosidase [Clostridium akagii]|uniref:amylo-alpha-1,6-glucosidase n=1 Tax=Clostridium akagii TaxID=91623 RepID=UPI000691C480|nr:amylo-alpha-1,6-glucosidase [Clostridium akagii]